MFNLNSLKKNKILVPGLIILSISIIALFIFNTRNSKFNIVTKDPSKKDVVANILGKDITTQELIGEEYIQYYELEKQLYDFKQRRLNQIIRERLISSEAAKSGLTGEEFIQKQIIKKIKISDSMINEFMKDKKIPDVQSRNPIVRARVRELLLVQKQNEEIQIYLASLTKSAPVEKYFQHPELSIIVDRSQIPSYGPANSKVQIIEFSDLQCSTCMQSTKTLLELKKKYNNNLQIFFRYFPSNADPQAQLASEGSLCMYDQGLEKYWLFRTALLNLSGIPKMAELEQVAAKIGADIKNWKSCMTSKKYAEQMRRDVQYAQKIGIRSSPVYFVNNRPVSAPLNSKDVDDIVEQ